MVALFDERHSKFGDYDFAFVGLNVEHRDECVTKIIRDYREYRSVCWSDRCDIKHGLVNIHSCEPTQFVLREYDTIADVLYNIDLGCCAVAYDGETTWLTPLAAVSNMLKINFIDPRACSLSYNYRLKKYFDRGFAICMPYYDVEGDHRKLTLKFGIISRTDNCIRGIVDSVAAACDYELSDLPSGYSTALEEDARPRHIYIGRAHV